MKTHVRAHTQPCLITEGGLESRRRAAGEANCSSGDAPQSRAELLLCTHTVDI